MSGVRFSVHHLKNTHRTLILAIPASITEDPIDVDLHLYGWGRDGKHIGISQGYNLMVHKSSFLILKSVNGSRDPHIPKVEVRQYRVRNHRNPFSPEAD